MDAIETDLMKPDALTEERRRAKQEVENMGLIVDTNRKTGVQTIKIKNHDGSTAGTITIRNPALKKTKRVNYKFRRISNQIIQTKTSGNARRVLASAKGETVNLRRKRATGDYNSSELQRAIRHAERMERVARKRMKHLQQEENIEKHGGGAWQVGLDEEDMDEMLKNGEGEEFTGLNAEEIKQLMQELQEELEQLQQENGLEELTQTIQVNMDPAQLEQLKKKHRAEEMREIMEADMQYLKALFDQLQKERQESASPSSDGVSLQLSGVEIPVQIDERSAAEVVSDGAAAAGGTIDISV